MKKKNDSIKTILKIALGLLLVAYVLHSKMIDFEALQKVVFDPRNLLLAFFFMALSAFCCALRWWLLVRAQGISLSLSHVVSLTMIGMFFNTIMPGAVGGDLIKAWYVAGKAPQQKGRAIFTLLLDRAIGMAVIVFYAATTMTLYTHWLVEHPQLKAVAYAVWIFTAASLLFGLFFFLPISKKIPGFEWGLSQLKRSEKLSKLLEVSLLYRNHFPTIVMAVSLSIISIFGMNYFYVLQGQALGITIGFAEYFFIVPIVMVVSAIPLLPGGIGTGQVAFFTLFTWMGINNPEQGGALCTLVQIYTILFNCLGAFFYFRFKRDPILTSNKESALDAHATSSSTPHHLHAVKPTNV